MTDKDAADTIGIIGRILWRSVLVGDPCPNVKAVYEWMSTPRPGDLVFEQSTCGGRHKDWGSGPIDAVGFLVRVQDEFVPFEYEEGEGPVEGDKAGYTETFTYIRTFDGREVRWHNCSFVALPSQMSGPPSGLVASQNGKITRDSLLTSLGGAGFKLKEAGK